MKPIYQRLMTLALCLTLVLGCMGLVSAENDDRPAQEDESAVRTTEEGTLREAASDSESVYVFTDASGAVEKLIVSDLSRDADGTERYQRAETGKEPPVELCFSYRLDGKEISPEELAGKSGSVEIRIDYINRASASREINGGKETLYTPFLMLSAVFHHFYGSSG